jgi:hypothetical protein
VPSDGHAWPAGQERWVKNFTVPSCIYTIWYISTLDYTSRFAGIDNGSKALARALGLMLP